ncbi:MAG: phage tail protein [Chloroflexi bacterium]|nr:MAG: phage tail protein [Chloroflexota bacterium]
MAVGDRNDPFRAYNYRVEIDGISVAGFSEASGLDNDVEPVEYREGTDPMYPRKLSAMRRFSNIMLSHGYTDNTELYDWYRAALNGPVDRRDGAVILQNESRDDVIRWNFSAGWVSKYQGATMNAGSNDVAIERIEICVERIELEFS